MSFTQYLIPKGAYQERLPSGETQWFMPGGQEVSILNPAWAAQNQNHFEHGGYVRDTEIPFAATLAGLSPEYQAQLGHGGYGPGYTPQGGAAPAAPGAAGGDSATALANQLMSRAGLSTGLLPGGAGEVPNPMLNTRLLDMLKEKGADSSMLALIRQLLSRSGISI